MTGLQQADPIDRSVELNSVTEEQLERLLAQKRREREQ